MQNQNQSTKFPKYQSNTQIKDNIFKIITDSKIYLKPLVSIKITSQEYLLLCKELAINPLQTLINDTDAEVDFAGIKIKSKIVFTN